MIALTPSSIARCPWRITSLILFATTTCAVLSAIAPRPAMGEDDRDFDTVVVPFLKRHCVRCHGPRKSESQLMLHKMTGTVGLSDVEVWSAVQAQARFRADATGR